MLWIFLGLGAFIVVTLTALLAHRFLRSPALPDFPSWPLGTLPFMIVPHEDFGTYEFTVAVEGAISFWNGISPGLFAPLGQPSLGASIPIMPDTQTGYARTGIIHNDNIISGAVYLNPDRTQDKTLTRAIAHELGHIMGLSHTEDRNSVMHRHPTNSFLLADAVVRDYVVAFAESFRV